MGLIPMSTAAIHTLLCASRWVAALALGVAVVPSQAQNRTVSPSTPASMYIFQCTNNQGRVLTSDRLIGECNDREQRLFTREGVLIRLIPPSLTASERVVAEAKIAKERVEHENREEAMRRDRQLMRRFSNELAHAKAREHALGPADDATRNTLSRLADLESERKPLHVEAEFYKGKPLPLKLRQQFEAVDATEAALKTAKKAQDEERARINESYDIELERLRKLWAGAQPGSLGPMRTPSGGISSDETKVAVAKPASEPAASPSTGQKPMEKNDKADKSKKPGDTSKVIAAAATTKDVAAPAAVPAAAAAAAPTTDTTPATPPSDKPAPEPATGGGGR
jgi:hypothetical protein